MFVVPIADCQFTALWRQGCYDAACLQRAHLVVGGKNRGIRYYRSRSEMENARKFSPHRIDA